VSAPEPDLRLVWNPESNLYIEAIRFWRQPHANPNSWTASEVADCLDEGMPNIEIVGGPFSNSEPSWPTCHNGQEPPRRLLARVARAPIASYEDIDIVPLHRQKGSTMCKFSFTGFSSGLDAAIVVEAADEAAAKKVLREKMGLKRLPKGLKIAQLDAHQAAETPVSHPGQVLQDQIAADIAASPDTPAETPLTQGKPKSSSKKKVEWKSLPNPEKLAHLLATPTISDGAHTDEKRLEKESRSDFLQRIYSS
jgi:hypothetical protein